jgi:hypothetical protein
MTGGFNEVIVVTPVDGDDSGRWSIPPDQQQALGQTLGGVLDDWAAQGPQPPTSTTSNGDPDPDLWANLSTGEGSW